MDEPTFDSNDPLRATFDTGPIEGNEMADYFSAGQTGGNSWGTGGPMKDMNGSLMWGSLGGYGGLGASEGFHDTAGSPWQISQVSGAPMRSSMAQAPPNNPMHTTETPNTLPNNGFNAATNYQHYCGPGMIPVGYSTPCATRNAEKPTMAAPAEPLQSKKSHCDLANFESSMPGTWNLNATELQIPSQMQSNMQQNYLNVRPELNRQSPIQQVPQTQGECYAVLNNNAQLMYHPGWCYPGGGFAFPMYGYHPQPFYGHQNHPAFFMMGSPVQYPQSKAAYVSKTEMPTASPATNSTYEYKYIQKHSKGRKHPKANCEMSCGEDGTYYEKESSPTSGDDSSQSDTISEHIHTSDASTCSLQSNRAKRALDAAGKSIKENEYRRDMNSKELRHGSRKKRTAKISRKNKHHHHLPTGLDFTEIYPYELSLKLAGIYTDKAGPRITMAAAPHSTGLMPNGTELSVDGFHHFPCRSDILRRYRAKRSRRSFVKNIRYQARKANADARPRVRGRFIKMDQDPVQKTCCSSKTVSKDNFCHGSEAQLRCSSTFVKDESSLSRGSLQPAMEVTL